MANAKTGITKSGFEAYRATHGRVQLHTLRSAYARRRAAVCAALGLTLAAFEARAKRAVEALVGFPGKYADRVQAYSYVASRLEASLPSVAPAVVAAPAPAPLTLVQMTDSKPYPGRPSRRVYLPCAMRPANDTSAPLTAADRAAMTRAWLDDRTG